MILTIAQKRLWNHKWGMFKWSDDDIHDKQLNAIGINIQLR